MVLQFQSRADITCFKCQGKRHIAPQCPNKKMIIINEDGDYETEGEDVYEGMPELVEDGEEEGLESIDSK